MIPARVPIPARLSSRIAYFRRAAGLTQFEVAQRSGIGPKSIGSYETGQAEPRVLKLLRILKACGVTPAQFFDCNLLGSEPVASRHDIRANESHESLN